MVFNFLDIIIFKNIFKSPLIPLFQRGNWFSALDKGESRDFEKLQRYFLHLLIGLGILKVDNIVYFWYYLFITDFL